MSLNLLRQGARVGRLTLPRLVFPARHAYSAQALQALSTSAPSDTLPESSQTPPEPVAAVNNAPTIPEKPPANPLKKPNKTRKKKRAAQDGTPPRDPLQPTRVDLYLASLTAQGLEPELADLERCRPQKHPRDDTPQYAEAYHALIDTLCRSFSKAQLRAFVVEYGLDEAFSNASMKKMQYAEAIMEQKWEWPSLKLLEQRKRDNTEVSVKSFPVTKSQLFLVLGKDGEELLRLTMRFKVHISLKPEPLSLRAEGVRSALRALEKELTKIKETIVYETLPLPTHASVPLDALQRISRLAGAFVENAKSPGLVRLCAKTVEDMNRAKRLVTRAISELHVGTDTPLLAYLPVGVASMQQMPSSLFAHSYGIYPFMSPQSLPWYLSTSGTFRARHIGEYLGDSGENVKQTGGLAGNKGRVLTVDHEAVELKTISQCEPLSDADPSKVTRQIKASLGHVLFAAPRTDGHPTFAPPLSGSHQFKSILDWIKNGTERTIFLPSLPVSLLGTSPSHQILLHRLVYKALPYEEPSKTKPPVDVNTTLGPEVLEGSSTEPKKDSGSVQDTPQTSQPEDIKKSTTSPPLLSSPTRNINFELALATSKDHSKDPTEEGTEKTIVPTVSLHPRSWMSSESEVDLMLPDRSTDIKFIVSDNTVFAPGEELSELMEYASRLQTYLTSTSKDVKQPDPPLILQYDDKTYVLHTSATTRRNVEESKVAESGDSSLPDARVQVVSESLLDLESNERTTRCEITCSDPTSDEAWSVFLKQCDIHTATAYRPTKSLPLPEDDEPGL